MQNSSLHQAIAQPDAKAVRLLLKNKADMYATNSEGTSAFSAAADSGNTEIVQLFLDAKADVSNRNHNGLTPLMFAITSKKAKANTVVQMLLEAKSDVNYVDTGQFTPLMFASKYGDDHMVRSILDAKVDPYKEDQLNYSLGMSIHADNPNIAQRLLNAKANVDAVRNHLLLTKEMLYGAIRDSKRYLSMLLANGASLGGVGLISPGENHNAIVPIMDHWFDLADTKALDLETAHPVTRLAHLYFYNLTFQWCDDDHRARFMNAYKSLHSAYQPKLIKRLKYLVYRLRRVTMIQKRVPMIPILNVIHAYLPAPDLSPDVPVDALLANSDVQNLDAAHPERALQRPVTDEATAVADICPVM